MATFAKLKSCSWEQFLEMLTQHMEVGLVRIPRRKRARNYRKGEVLHITSRCHFKTGHLSEKAAKQIVARELLHYGRVCRIEVLHYSIMDNHVHIIVRMRRRTKHALVAKMIGTFKAQVTRRYKAWFNGPYRRAKKFRPAKLGKGSLWDDRFTVTVATDSPGLIRVVAYVELNQIRSRCRHATTKSLSVALLAEAAVLKAHSASWYLGSNSLGALTDGTDGVWATHEEIKAIGGGPLPVGWRFVWFDAHRRVLKPTPDHERRAPHSPITAVLQRLWGPFGYWEYLSEAAVAAN